MADRFRCPERQRHLVAVGSVISTTHPLRNTRGRRVGPRPGTGPGQRLALALSRSCSATPGRIGWLVRWPRRSTAFQGKRTEKPTTPGKGQTRPGSGSGAPSGNGAEGDLVQDPGAARRLCECGPLSRRSEKLPGPADGVRVGVRRSGFEPGSHPSVAARAVATSVASKERNIQLSQKVDHPRAVFGGSTTGGSIEDVLNRAVCRARRQRGPDTPPTPSARFGSGERLCLRAELGDAGCPCCGCTLGRRAGGLPEAGQVDLGVRPRCSSRASSKTFVQS